MSRHTPNQTRPIRRQANLTASTKQERRTEETEALTAVLVVLEDFAHVAGVHEAEELLGQTWTEITLLLLLQAESGCLLFRRRMLAAN